jgi:sortase A
MPDRRSIDDLSIEELEEILAVRKREAREARLQRLRGEGRVIDLADLKDEPVQIDRPVGEAVDTSGSYYRSGAAVDEKKPRWRLQLKPSKSRVRTWRDRFLLLIEIGAVVGLIAVAINFEQSRIETNQPVVNTDPTPTPAPLITAVVLPSGHRPPTAPGGAAPNLLDEVPAHLRDVAQSITPAPIPTPGPGQPTRIDIPALGIVNQRVVEGDDWDQLKKGVGHHLNTANPGERGNLVLSGHDDIFGEIFKHLDQLKPGDEVIVYSNNQRYRYVVSGQRIIQPTQVEVMLPTSDPTVTLISCYPYLIDTQRIVVFAQLVQ